MLGFCMKKCLQYCHILVIRYSEHRPIGRHLILIEKATSYTGTAINVADNGTTRDGVRNMGMSDRKEERFLFETEEQKEMGGSAALPHRPKGQTAGRHWRSWEGMINQSGGAGD